MTDERNDGPLSPRGSRVRGEGGRDLSWRRSPHPPHHCAAGPLPLRRGERAMTALVSDRPLDLVADFPAIPAGWAYLDTAATAQKPRPVLDAIATRLWRDLRHRASRRVPALGRHDARLRGRAAARRALRRRGVRRARSCSCAARPRRSTSSRKAGGSPISSPATASCSRRSSITATSCRGSCSATAPASSSTSAR